VFCVRSDDATAATAWTPAVGRYDGLTLAVLGRREPRRTAAVRDAIVTGLHEGRSPPATPAVGPGVTLVGGGPGDPELISVAGAAR
jgi:uroporphyrin-III C-methyltransferase/precorrin-2 dehydrogenase/sirohydrochlorin ferrochelatase